MVGGSARLWVENLTLTNFRNYRNASLVLGPEPIILIGLNGSGKTNLLEAISLLVPGQGLRRAAFSEIPGPYGNGDWSVAARVHNKDGFNEIGTGQIPVVENSVGPSGRIVRINGVSKQGSGALAGYADASWVTPSMDSLFTGPSSERRRFLDRIVLNFEPEHARRYSAYERAMQQRNRLLSDNIRENGVFSGLESVMAEMAVAIAAARVHIVSELKTIAVKRRLYNESTPFPWAEFSIQGSLETDLESIPAVDVEDRYVAALRDSRERDRIAGRTLEGPHRSDFIISHGPKKIPARLCSTGEQKALLLGLVLAHIELASLYQRGRVPILLLDEVTAHLDEDRRAALCNEILKLGCQAWLTGTDLQAFEALTGQARVVRVNEGKFTLLP